MSKNINQIYTTNPSTTMTSTDLLYKGISPFGATNDSAITWGNLQTSITAVGTISAGTWHGSVITGTYGGTGVNNGSNTFTYGGNVTFSGAFTFTGTLTANTSVTFPTSGTLATTSQLPTGAALTEVNDTNVTLTLGGSPSTALLNAASITAGWAGQLSLARGGTNSSLTASNGGIFYSTASAGAILSGTATANQVLLSGSNTTPAWSTATYPPTTTANQILYSSSTNIVTGLASVANSILTTNGSSVPTYALQSAYLKTANNLSELFSASTQNIANQNLIYVSTLTTNFTLVSTDWGKTIYLSPSSNITITLSSPLASSSIKFICTGITNTVTITAPSGKINNLYTSIIVGGSDTFEIFSNGTNYYISTSYVTPVNASVYLNSNISLADSTQQAILYDTVTSDSYNMYNATTGKFTPLVPGNYEASIVLCCSSSGTTGVLWNRTLFNNGIGQFPFGFVESYNPGTLSSNFPVLYNSVLFPMNGSTDFVITNIFQTTGVSQNILGFSGGILYNYFIMKRYSYLYIP